MLIEQGEKAKNANKHGLSLTIFKKALTQAEKEQEKPLIAKSLERIGDLTYIKLKNDDALHQALNHYKQALKLFLDIDPKKYVEDLIAIRLKIIHITKELEEKRNTSKKKLKKLRE